MSEESFDKVIDVNLKGTFLINQLTASAMKEADIKGSIVNISSITGKTGRCHENEFYGTGSPHITLFLFFMKSSVKWNSCKVKHSILILK